MNTLATHITKTLMREYSRVDFSEDILQQVIQRAITEHEKAQYFTRCAESQATVTMDAAPLCVYCGKPELSHGGKAVFCNRFTPATPKLTEPGYRMLKEGEEIQAQDETLRDNGWGEVKFSIGTHLVKTSVGLYRRKLTDIQPVIDNPYLGALTLAQGASSDGAVAPRNPAKEPTTQEVIEKETI